MKWNEMKRVKTQMNWTREWVKREGDEANVIIEYQKNKKKEEKKEKMKTREKKKKSKWYSVY